MKKTLWLLASLVTAIMATPQAAATPADAFAIPLTGAPPFFGVPPGPPALVVGPFVISRVTADTTTGLALGAGACIPSSVGEACFTLPAFNPFLGAPTVFADCEITAAVGPWIGFGLLPELYLVQDLTGDTVLGNPGDVFAGPIGFAYGSPPGFLPAAFPAGAAGGIGFVPFAGPFAAGFPIHFVAGHTGAPLGPWSALLSMTVTCLVI